MWQYLWVTGSDFDGNESDRLVAGGFVALDVIQAGKVFKLAKVKVSNFGFTTAKKVKTAFNWF